MFIHCKKGPELRHGYPDSGTAMWLHILFQEFRDRVIDGHHPHHFVQFTCWKKLMRLLTARSMTAAVGCAVRSIIGLAAAGITVFQGGRAGFPVAYISCFLVVYFTACAGVFIDAPSLYRDSRFSVVDCAFGWFLHCVTR
jgi:uncharacterized membrane protein YbhN (UPF0104 family)